MQKAINEDGIMRVSGTIEGRKYFAYGSNMDESQMVQRCPTAKLISRAQLNGYKFIINSRGVASVVPERNCRVEGLVWTIYPVDEASLDRYEGVRLDYYYKTDIYVVEMISGETSQALVYIASDNNVGRPRPGYLEKIVKAAEDHGFDRGYIEFLKHQGL